MGVSLDTKLLLYAPTYRSYERDKENEDIDFHKILKILEQKTKDKWALVFRIHHASKQHNNFYGIDSNGLFDDIMEFLPFVDMLISDYSSCAGDFLLSDKPVILYINDYKDYEKADKGVFFNIYESPYLKATNNKELINIIKNYDSEKYKENCKAVLDFYGNYECGNAREELCKIIAKFLRIKEKNK